QTIHESHPTRKASTHPSSQPQASHPKQLQAIHHVGPRIAGQRPVERTIVITSHDAGPAIRRA
ncbi:hypothetical protein ACFXG4_36740, partial [Nocardia sp. NPDC059246]|uniref:hypothetical protein n=1 Tax=unclassified Nocardia TaxID=2637762 RepID=UPI0036993679